jgi:hypothetical protein
MIQPELRQGKHDDPALPVRAERRMTMSAQFTRASRERIRLRMAIDGPSGSGKSVTADRLAKALGSRIAVVCTERGSARKYVGEVFDPGEGPIQFDVAELTSFAPTEYTALIEEAGRAAYDVLVIDGLSQAWEGKEGALEMVDRKGGNRFTAWKDVTPMHRRMVDAILTSPCHVIVTMRSKTEYVLEKNEQGKEVPRKVGVAPIQRPGMEYEFDIYGSMDWAHVLTVTKSRCRAVDGATAHKPGAAWMGPVIEWLGRGSSAPVTGPRPTIRDDQVAEVTGLLRHLCWPLDRVAREFPRKFGCKELRDLYQEQADALIRWLAAQLASRQRHGAANGQAPAPSTPAVARAGADQLALIRRHRDELFTRLGVVADGEDAVSAAWRKVLGNYSVTTARDLTPEQAARLISNLAHRLNSLDLAEQPTDPAERESMRAAAEPSHAARRPAQQERKEEALAEGTKSPGV